MSSQLQDTTLGYGRWGCFCCSTDCDYSRKTAERRADTGDVLLEVNATDLSHLPCRPVINKLCRLGAARLRQLIAKGLIHRKLNSMQATALLAELGCRTEGGSKGKLEYHLLKLGDCLPEVSELSQRKREGIIARLVGYVATIRNFSLDEKATNSSVQAAASTGTAA